MEESKPFSDILSGKNAFYNSSNYLSSTKRDLVSDILLPAIYTVNIEHKIIRIGKQVFSTFIFPIGIYLFLHSLAGRIILRASNPCLIGYPQNYANKLRSHIFLNSEWKYKRITIAVDDYKVDAMIIGKASTLGNRRWVLASNGNGEFYEEKPFSKFQLVLDAMNGNAIVFNYPGVGASSGSPNRQAMAKAYRALLRFLEDQDKGVGAKEIIGYGHSIGGGVQGDALNTHKLKEDVKYVFVKSRSFSDLATTVSILTRSSFLGFLVKFLGWNMDPVEASKKLQVPEIIMQTADVKDYEVLENSSKIMDDGIIPVKSSLAKVLLDDNQSLKSEKLFIGMHEGHNDELEDPSYLVEKIESYLKI